MQSLKHQLCPFNIQFSKWKQSKGLQISSSSARNFVRNFSIHPSVLVHWTCDLMQNIKACVSDTMWPRTKMFISLAGIELFCWSFHELLMLYFCPESQLPGWQKWIHACTPCSCWSKRTEHFKSRVPDQNGVSQAWFIVEIHHSGQKPSKWSLFITPYLITHFCCKFLSRMTKGSNYAEDVTVPAELGLFVCWLLNVPATCECISGTDLHRQFYVLPHWDRSCRSNFPSRPVTVYWHWADQSQRWPYNARRLAG